ncbi:MAG: TlpA family protein disulfide reductase [Candidatus Acetothermia bacterium]|jgi:peroxiredoxin|nr:TlpA family protein disulfide reductase [Candidatus Acetothermia bacterium]
MDARWLALGLAILLVAAFLFQPQEGRLGEGTFPIVGRPAPEFALAGLGGGFNFAAQRRGRPMVLAFWTTWCGACKHDLAILEGFHRRYGDRVVVVGICPERWGEVPEIAARYGITFPILFDPGAGVTRAYQLSENLRYPFTVFVDARGEVSGVWAVSLRDLDFLLDLLGKAGISLPR